MGKNKRFEESDIKKYLRQSKKLNTKSQGLTKEKFLVFGFRNIDSSQGQDYKDWEINKILSKALSRITGLCSMTLEQAKQSKIIKIYGQGIPPKSTFFIPNCLKKSSSTSLQAILNQKVVVFNNACLLVSNKSLKFLKK